MSRLPFDNLFEIESQKEMSFPTKEAQLEHLTQLLEHTKEELLFRRGEQVSYFPASGPLTRRGRVGLVLMFWEYLEPGSLAHDFAVSEVAEIERATLPDIDCLLVFFDGEQVQFAVSCSDLLMKVPN